MYNTNIVLLYNTLIDMIKLSYIKFLSNGIFKQLTIENSYILKLGIISIFLSVHLYKVLSMIYMNICCST